MRIAIAGGGTGGHLFPALAVAEVLRSRGHELLIFISEKEIDALATKDRGEFRFEKLPGIGMPKIFSPAIFKFLKQFNAGLAPCRAIYREFKPDAVLGMGGFTSTAPILAGMLRKIPTFVHESNAIPGKANRLNAKMTKAVLLGFADCAKYFPKSRCEVTGTPIRRSLAGRVPREQALAAFGLKPDRKTLLVMGGSQGARGINKAVLDALPEFKKDPLQIIHLTGREGEAEAIAAYKQADFPAYAAAFYHKMEEAYSAADCAISRSGAASLAELSHFAIPSILIPYPHAAENHQALNAEIFARAGAAEVLVEAETTAEILSAKVRALVGDTMGLQRMSERLKTLAPAGAAERVADVIEKFHN
ncbi:MAG TPA: undecaprenyldiphospho-muramoylpentapeptide beta-N-acetylglucosaminyltransferase [Chthoniobacteraceae bacterium]|nr:undecaprenyldiphospho-muramoylpentapeptide beta-N-acetylglucosaminyltransferase [Chthoniobacteraceae bacterium]